MSSVASEAAKPSAGARPPTWRRVVESPYLLGGGYVLAVILTITGALLASRPPEVGPISADVQVMLGLLVFNLVLILALASLVALRVMRLLLNRNNDAGARLQLRFMALFSLATVAPAIVVALFFGGVVISGVDYWFSQKVRTIVENSATVARTYVDEQTKALWQDTTEVGRELNRASDGLSSSPIAYSHYLGQLARGDFVGVYVIDRDGRVMARAEAPNAPAFLAPPRMSFDAADDGDSISAETFPSTDVFRGLYRLRGYEDAYLYVVRPASAGIISQLRDAEAQLVSYREADDNKLRLQGAFALTYVETVLLLLVGAAWLAIPVGNSIAAPVARLVQAAGRIAGGDLSVRVETGDQPQEMAGLSRAFNSMTSDLQAQQAALKDAGLEAESRRQFIETVLSGVSAGVVGLDADGRVSAANRQAAILLGVEPGAMNGRPLEALAPELVPVAGRAAEIQAEVEEEVDVAREAETRRLRVRASGAASDGVVLTFDDITRLITAQRNAAWRDVARRIAHEIKNPLTPIQLSAERIRRKYRKDITTDLEIFDRCTDTIIRQVGDIGRMVDEFSAFARMPAPRFADADPAELLRQAVFAQRVASPKIEVSMDDPPEGVVLSCDERMVGQALANILKNAAEAVSASDPAPGAGRIHAALKLDGSKLIFEIEDNGVGLPSRDRDRLTEPYVTTREKGTGLGLAIVKRILEDHGGELALGDAVTLSGARVTLCFPLARRTAAPELKEAAHGG
ncbi:sensor histidine kinase NtrY-like [Caulobacter mirabilis]|uniref:histidine kinase n=1 Tax=Caulobacter mirabilis TaxID=69666 RepID=A0A2D2AY93_9CAUL|nr:PAS domain-containing sensor histidine kinase [Caulobacter mirabilis]ATQ42986.1 PAS domain-containing sensor histidine kinase [Caulobacter mirabilis]